MSVEDLQGGFISEVQSGEEREEELREKYQDDGDGEVEGDIRDTFTILTDTKLNIKTFQR